MWPLKHPVLPLSVVSGDQREEQGWELSCQSVSAAERSPDWKAFLLGSVLPLQAPGSVRSRSQGSRPILLPATQWGHLLSAGGDSPQAPVPQFSLLLFIQLCPQQDAAAGLPDNCQPEVWTPSPWWLSLFH